MTSPGIGAALKAEAAVGNGLWAATFCSPQERSERDAGHEAEDRGILNGAGSVGLDDVLNVGLEIGPLVDLQAVVDFQHTRVVGLIDGASLLQRLDVVEAVLAKAESCHQVVFVARRDQPFVNEARMKIKRQNVVVLG